MGRLLALCGWLAWRVRRLVPGGASAAAPVAVAALLIVVALVPVVLPVLDAQPQPATVQQILDRQVTEPTGWVRLSGKVVPLRENPSDLAGGRYAIFVDGVDPLRAIVIRSEDAPQAAEQTVISGHLVPTGVTVEEELPLEATVFGALPQIVRDRVIEIDPAAKPERATLWPLAIPPALLATVLLAGTAAGYPIFRPTTEVDVVSAPLGPGERLPAAFGGTVGPTTRELADPSGALLLVRRGPKGNLLTAQPLADDGGVAPAPVTIGGSWTSGRVGQVYTISETVPALFIRSELVNATFLFARTSERDRVAALVAVER